MKKQTAETGGACVWRTDIRDEQARRYFRKAGPVNQVKFWLMEYLNEGKMNEYWEGITA